MPPLGVRYGDSSVHVIGGGVNLALDAAVKGNVDEAMKLLAPVKDHTPATPDYYVKDTLPQFGIRHPRVRTAEQEHGGNAADRPFRPDDRRGGDRMASQPAVKPQPGQHDDRRDRWQLATLRVDTKGAVLFRGAKKVKGRKKR